MKDANLQNAEKYTKAHQRRKRWRQVVTALAAVVVFCTTYALILPAITLEKECQIPEHVHSDACYQQETVTKQVPVCTLETLNIHQHTKECWDDEKNLICGYADYVVHEHDSHCYDEDGNLWCDLPEKTLHTHEDSCYEAAETVKAHQHTKDCYTKKRGDLTCTEHEHTDSCWSKDGTLLCGEESDHQHTDACYEWKEILTCNEDQTDTAAQTKAEPKLICEKEEIILHEHQPYQSKSNPGCYDETGKKRICGKLQVIKHQHTDACLKSVEEPGENKTLICDQEEHTHSDACRKQETVDTGDRVEHCITLIEKLPTAEEIGAKLEELEASEDTKAYENYYEDIYQQARTAYVYYEDLGEKLQKQVTNREKLLELEWLYSVETMALEDLSVYQINNYTNAVTTLVYGGSVKDKLGNGMSFKFWDAVIVETNASGNLYVAQYITKDVTKLDYVATTENGFVLLLYNTTLNNITSRLPVDIDFDYKIGTGAYNENGYGKIYFNEKNTGLTTVKGADTSDIIEVNLYDYGDNINDLYSKDNKYPGFQQDEGQKTVYSTASSNFGNNITADLAAGKSSITNHGGDINKVINTANSPISGAMSNQLGTDGQPALADGTSLGYLFSDGEYAVKQNTNSINGLFKYNETTGAYTFNSRENHAQFNKGNDTFTLYNQLITSNVFWYPFGNFLPFNDIVHQSAQASTINASYLKSIAASAKDKYSAGMGDAYNTLSSSLETFITKMNAETKTTNWTSADCINEYFESAGIPKRFTASDAELQNIYSIDFDEPTDFFFGMEMKMKFMQPHNGLTGKDGKQEMIFYFTGDDDVWVYIDGVLFLDLSGIHRHVGGQIDFVKGTVSYYDLDVQTGDVSTTPTKTVKFSDLVDKSILNEKGTFKDYTTHTFNFYYMERGAGSGVCRMNFNFPLLKKNVISVTKKLSVDEGDEALLGNPDFRFQVLKENGDLFIPADTTFDIFDGKGNDLGLKGKTDKNGVFTLKANQTAVFRDIQESGGKYYVRELLNPDAFSQYGKIEVDGTSQTENYDVTIGTDTFTGVNSPVKDISDGNTSFFFNNTVTRRKTGGLAIEKKVTPYGGSDANGSTTGSTGSSAKTFQFEVTLDGELLPTGTTYKVGEETRTSLEEGIIQLKPGERAEISNILLGTVFTVKEIGDLSDYKVTYQIDQEETVASNQGVTGTIRSENTSNVVRVLVDNQEKGASVTIPVQKTLVWSGQLDSLKHEYTINLEQVSDSSGTTSTDPAYTQTLTFAFSGDSTDSSVSSQVQTNEFTINYAKSDWKELPKTFYYKITEAKGSEAGTVYDASSYVVEVTVQKKTDGTDASADLIAAITGVWKDGEKWTLSTDESLSFTNRLQYYELPQTGGSGTMGYTLGGMTLVLSAAVLLWYLHKTRRKIES